MKIPERGLGEEALFERIDAYRKDDLRWRDGKVWGYVFDAGRKAEAIGKRAYAEFMSENALDPTVYPSLLRFENEVIAMAAEHLGGDQQVAGTFTSGGTESIILAMKVAREHGLSRGIARPQVIVPVTAHAAFHKASHYLGIDLLVTPVDPASFEADVDAMAAAISDSTVMLVGSATSYAHGVLDPIEKLGALAQERDLLLHVDGCIGGFLLPYMKRLGEPIPAFDFSVPGVTSISMDLHKYAYCPKGASVVLYRSKELRKHQLFACARWTGYTLINSTVQSTKSGGPLAAAWAVLNYMGDEGYLAIARSLLEARKKLVVGIDAIEGLRVLGKPAMSLLCFTSDTLDFFALADAMKRRGWYVQPQLGIDEHPANIHLSINPNNVPVVESFLVDLAACAAEAPPRDATGIGAAVRQTFASMSPEKVDDTVIRQMLSMTGVGGFEVPEETALVNTALDALPPAIKERVLIEFVNELFRQP